MEQSLELEHEKTEEKDPENEGSTEVFYKMSEFVKLTGLSEHTIREWANEYNIQIARTKPQGGQRRFTKKNLELYKAINHRLHELGWSSKEVRAWINGDTVDPLLESAEVQSNLEKKLDALHEEVKQLREENQAMVHTMKAMQELIKQRDENVVLQLRNIMNEKQLLLQQKNENENVLARLWYAAFPKKKQK